MRIVIFDIDCLRPDHLGCYGYARPTSPNIDRIAGQGVRFEHYHCADSPCLPSRMGFVSGRFGIHNGVVSNVGVGSDFHIRKRHYGGPEGENEMLMRQLRKEADLDTISFSNFADRHCAMWFENGWSEFHTPNLRGGAETAEEVNAPVLRWLRDNAKRENYLLHINYWDPHRLYKMAPKWADHLRDTPVPVPWPDEGAFERLNKIDGPFCGRGQFRDHKSTVPLMPGKITNRAEFEHAVTGYDAAISYTDHHVGVVLDELERQGVLEDAAVIITSDHGDAFGEHGIFTDHVTADECIHRVPLIIRWPGVAAAGGRCESLLYNVDLAATLCDLLGAEAPSEWDGESFASHLRGEGGIDREYLVWGHALYTVQRAVRTKQHLMIRTYDDIGMEINPVELYDMDADPYQTRDISASDPDTLMRCDHYLTEWLQEQLMKPDAIPDPFGSVLRERTEQRRTENAIRRRMERKA